MSDNNNLSEQMAKLLNGLNDEQKEKAMACKTMEELTAFLGELGAALPDVLLDTVAGGSYLQTGEYDDDEWEWHGPSKKYPNPFQFYLRIPSGSDAERKCKAIYGQNG